MPSQLPSGRPLNVVAIGGGTGLSTLLRGLKRYVGTEIADLAAVVTVTDDGGSSGRLRKEFNILPPGEGGLSFSAVPVTIGNSPAFTDLITGTWAACGRTAAGAVSCWGINAHGEIGVAPAGLDIRYLTPQPLSGGGRWSMIAGSLATFCGLEAADGTWCWGDGGNGELGADLDASTVPVRVGGV